MKKKKMKIIANNEKVLYLENKVKNRNKNLKFYKI